MKYYTAVRKNEVKNLLIHEYEKYDERMKYDLKSIMMREWRGEGYRIIALICEILKNDSMVTILKDNRDEGKEYWTMVGNLPKEGVNAMTEKGPLWQC